MTGFRVDRFSGERPIDNARKLPPSAARSAIDSNLRATDLRPFAEVAHIGNGTSVSGNPKSAFIFNESYMFVFAADVATTFGPLQADNSFKNKVFISSGYQDYPVYSTMEMGLPLAFPNYYGPPFVWRKLGVPAPDAVPTVSLTAIATAAVTSLDIDGTTIIAVCGLPHGLDSLDRVRLSGFNSEWSDVNENVFTISLIDGEPNKFRLNNYDATPHIDGTASGTGIWTQEFNSEDMEDRLYVYTYVTEDGEEGPPSEPTTMVSIYPGQTATITTATSLNPEPNVIIATKRIYRTVPTSAGTADYYFVAEEAISDPTFEDIVEFISLGEALPSLEWYPPPAGLKGLTVLPNGIMAGYVGRTIYLSEPYQPHAWPDSYTKKMDNDIVGLAAFAQSLVVATTENPYVGTATDPLSMTFSKLDTVEPCIAGRACQTLGYGAAYPSPNGLVLVTPAGSKNVLQNVWSEKEWRALFTAGEAFAQTHDGKYYLFFSNGDAIVFDPTSETLEISHITVDKAYGAAVDRDEDRLYLLRYDTGTKITEWNPDSGTTYMETAWTSKTFVMPYPVNMGAYQAFFTGAGTLSVDFVADGVVVHTATITDQEPHRLPSGFLAREWSLVIRSTVEVQGIYVAETISELRGALAS